MRHPQTLVAAAALAIFGAAVVHAQHTNTTVQATSIATLSDTTVPDTTKQPLPDTTKAPTDTSKTPAPDTSKAPQTPQ